MNKFIIEPYVGPLPLRFGMSPQDVEAILGDADKITSNDTYARIELRDLANIGFSNNGTLNEVIFKPRAHLALNGVYLFEHDDPITILRMSDPHPQLFVGVLVFLKLGISLSGFHDNDESQKAISIFARGMFDDFLDEFEPFE